MRRVPQWGYIPLIIAFLTIVEGLYLTFEITFQSKVVRRRKSLPASTKVTVLFKPDTNDTTLQTQ